jgi:hypothetical protein
MTRRRWWLALGAVLALGGAAQAEDKPCHAPRPCSACTEQPTAAQKQAEANAKAAQGAIEQKLDAPISLSFKDTPLSQIIDDLHALIGINVVADTAALEEAGVRLEQPLSLKVECMSLKSALNILLKQARLTYVIKDEALQITTEDAARGKLRMLTYPVADLVVPIGEGENDLPSFLCRAAGCKEPAADGKRAPCITCEDLLIRLITRIEPASWTDLGGPGTVQYFPLGLALVVNQTPEVHERIQELLVSLRRQWAEEYPECYLDTRIVEKVEGVTRTVQLPRATFMRGQQFTISVGGSVLVRDGSIQDLNNEIRGQAAQAEAETVCTGLVLRAKVTAAEGARLRLDATLRRTEIVEATRDGLQFAERSYRVIRRVECGKPVKVVLDKDNQGKPMRWLECTVTELERPAEAKEEVFMGNLPPIPR